MKRARTIIGALCVGVLFAGGVWAKKIVTVGAHCPQGAGDRLIDADGEKDACTGSGKISCRPGQSLDVDVRGDRDVCREAGGDEARPICPTGFSQKVRPGEDTCDTRMRPMCRKGYKLRVRAGEDVCVY